MEDLVAGEFDKKLTLKKCKMSEKSEIVPKKNNPRSTDMDSYYFCSYGESDIHCDMLLDEVRTGTFRLAIELNRHLFLNKIVLDIGCGTGILSIFAAKAGASKVVAVERAKIVNFAKETVKRNNYENIIEVMEGKMENLNLVNKVDVIVSEWMGYCLLLENMLETVIDARDKWLTDDGILLPDYASLYITTMEERQYQRYELNWWYNVYGYDASCIKEQALSEPSIKTVYPNMLLSDSYCFKDFDLYKVTNEQLDFQSTFRLKFDSEGSFDAFVIYFSVDFIKCHTSPTINTSPHEPATHWKHTVFYLRNPISVKSNEEITGKVVFQRNKENKRDLQIQIKFEYLGNNGEQHQQLNFCLH